jgi:signal-transduction protein with cAMP-binding, CBS, and nucleotidyltransferase domain
VYKIKYAIRDFAYHREIRDEVLSAIWYEFKKHIIEIPYPIRTVIMKEPTPRGTDPRLTETLAQIPFFAGISKAGISNLCMFGLFRDCEEGDVIIENDKEGDSMFFVLEGSFNVIRHNQAVSVLCKGDFFGEMSLLTGEKRNARVVAKTPGRLLEIDRHAFKTVLDNEPGIMSQIENVFNIRARAIKEESPNAVKTEEIKQNFWSRFKQIFGLT